MFGIRVMDRLWLRWPWVHRRQIEANIGDSRDLTLERLLSVRKPEYCDGPVGARNALVKVLEAPIVGRLLHPLAANLVMKETLSVKRLS